MLHYAAVLGLGQAKASKPVVRKGSLPSLSARQGTYRRKYVQIWKKKAATPGFETQVNKVGAKHLN